MRKIAYAGNFGKGVRSDCLVTLELKETGGINIDIKSKVKPLFGDKILKLSQDELAYFGIENCNLTIQDSGALDYVIMARLEAAIKQLIDTKKEFIPEILSQNQYTTQKDQPRRSRLYLPGNTPKLAINAGIHQSDGIILDLEDSVAPAKKFEAKILVRNTLRAVDFYGVERMVRMNQLPLGLDDLEYVVPHHVNLILVPKCEKAEDIYKINKKINAIKKERNIDYPIYLMPIIESALGIINSYSIATAADNVVALAIGLEDYTADLGTQRTQEGKETFFARSMLVNSCKAAGIQAIDSVFSDINDMEALKNVVLESKSLGFDGMGCIHPRQIKVIHENYAPNQKEIDKAKKIVVAFYEAEQNGLGVVSVGSKMVDPPVVKRALKTIAQAIEVNKLDKDWMDEYKEAL